MIIFPHQKKMRDLRTGDVFERDGHIHVTIADPYYGTVWATKPEFGNEEGNYSYTTAALLSFGPEQEVKVTGRDERTLVQLKCCYNCANYERDSRNCAEYWDGVHDFVMDYDDSCEHWEEMR